MADFQTSVNIQPAPAVAGDFASANPRVTVLAGPGQLVSGPGGVTVGTFVWLDSTYTQVSSNASIGIGNPTAPAGFLGRQGQPALITTFLAKTSNIVPPGLEVTVHSAGDFWVTNSGTNQVVPGMYAYANLVGGLVTFNSSNTTPTAAASVTASIAAGTGSATGSISGGVLTITGVVTGSFQVGGTISGGATISGTMITSQLTGTANGIGTYAITPPEQTVASTTISETHGIMTVTNVGSGTVSVGDVLVAGGGGNGAVVAGTYVSALGTGSGGNGTYIVTNNTVVTSGTIVLNGNVLTKWQAMSFAAPNELVKMSSWLQG